MRNTDTRPVRFELVDRLALLALAMLTACGPVMPTTDGGADAGALIPFDAGLCGPKLTETISACMRPNTDYQPRSRDAGTMGWPACTSDDGTFRLLGTGLPPAAARVAAFETMAGKLWRNSHVPTPADFLSARDDYSVAEGLASRVGRRQDVTYPETPGTDKFACSNEGVPAMYPDRCAGPAKVKPIIDDAFQRGANNDKPLVQAARIEAALIWFFHLSMTSEVWTCSFDDKEDCDSAGAYYQGDPTMGAPRGYGAYVLEQGPATHAAIRDALLGERCWRDVDTALPATNTMLYNRAQDQLQRASLRGVALVLRARVVSLGCQTGDQREASQEFVNTLGMFLQHAAQARNPNEATRLPTTGFILAAQRNIDAAVTAIDTIFGCPY